MVLAERNRRTPADGCCSGQGQSRTYRVTTTAHIEIESSLTHVFDITTGADTLPQYFHGDGPFPGVVRVEMANGARPHTGTIRKLVMTDGSEIEEEVVQYMRPLRFIYQIKSGLRGPFARLVSGIVSDWTFIPYQGTVGVTYEVHFHATSLMAYPVVLWLARFYFRRVQEDALQRIAELAYTLPDQTI